MSHALARLLSISGHPMLVLPVVVVAIALARGERAAAAGAALGLGLFAALVMAFSWWQVRRGRWAHVDASQRQERSHLNRFLLATMVAGAAWIAWHGTQPLFALGMAMGAAMILAAMLAARWCTLSLHMAFAVFSAWLLRELGLGWMLLALAFALAVAWSRLALRRHEPRDLVAGALTGSLAGAAFWPLASYWMH